MSRITAESSDETGANAEARGAMGTMGASGRAVGRGDAGKTTPGKSPLATARGGRKTRLR